MKLKAVVESLNDVPEHFHEAYVERDGKYFLDVIGIKTDADIARIQATLSAEREAHKKTKEAFKVLDGYDLTDVVTKLDKYGELELLAEGTKVDEAKLNEMVEKRIVNRLTPIEREKNRLSELAKDLEGKVGQYQQQAKIRNIHDSLREACLAAKVRPEAIDDVLLLGERVCDYDEALGKTVTRDNVGVTPGVEPTVWLSEIQAKRPHWWGDTVGTGADGSGSAGGGANPFTFENWNLTEQGRLVTANPGKAEQMAKSAGTFVGGAKPSPRK